MKKRKPARSITAPSTLNTPALQPVTGATQHGTDRALMPLPAQLPAYVYLLSRAPLYLATHSLPAPASGVLRYSSRSITPLQGRRWLAQDPSGGCCHSTIAHMAERSSLGGVRGRTARVAAEWRQAGGVYRGVAAFPWRRSPPRPHEPLNEPHRREGRFAVLLYSAGIGVLATRAA